MSVLVSVKRVANNSLQAELLDTVTKTGAVNVLALLNEGDERFKQGSARRAWFPVTIESLRTMGVKEVAIAAIEALKEDEKYDLNLDNPTINGLLLRIQVTESVVPDLYQRQYVMKTAKQIMISDTIAKKGRIPSDYPLAKYVNKNGYFVDADGNFIFSKANVSVEGQVNHTFINGKLIPETELSAYGATLAEGVDTTQLEGVTQ